MKTIFTTLCLALATSATVNAQTMSVEGKLSATAGSYVIPDFGEVSTPELGNDFHMFSAEVYDKPSARAERKAVTYVLGGFVRSYSKFNSNLTSIGIAPRLGFASGRFHLQGALGPVLQHRDHKFALGGTFNMEARVDLCEVEVFGHTDIEIAGRGLFADIEAGALLLNRFEIMCGGSFFRSGNFLSANVLVGKERNVKFGATYVWNRSMNEVLQEAGLGEFKRRGLGLQCEVSF